MREVAGNMASVSGFGIPSRTMASSAFRARASVSKIQAVLAWLPEILAHSDESSSATSSQWWHTCVTLIHLKLCSSDQGGSTSATRRNIRVREPSAAEGNRRERAAVREQSASKHRSLHFSIDAESAMVCASVNWYFTGELFSLFSL
jgi:hypothetical protein